MQNILDYSKTYREQTDWVSEMYDKQYEKWELNNDSIFIDFEVDNEEPDGKYYYAPMSLFQISDPFNPPNLGFEIFKSGNQDFKMVDNFTTSIISELMDGADLEYLKENTNEVEKKIVQEYMNTLKRWSDKIDVTQVDYNEFWIENRKFIQNDKELKYLLYKRLELWKWTIGEQVDVYIENVENNQKILDSMINIFDKEKYFLYWKID